MSASVTNVGSSHASISEIDDNCSCSITVRRWDMVASWSWGVQSESCPVCRNMLADACIDCQAKGIQPNNGENSTTHDSPCTVAWGACNHVFHMHCINRWLTAQRVVCPVCGRGWELLKTASNE